MLNLQPFVRVIHVLCPKHAEHSIQVSDLEIELGIFSSGNHTAFGKEVFDILGGNR